MGLGAALDAALQQVHQNEAIHANDFRQNFDVDSFSAKLTEKLQPLSVTKDAQDRYGWNVRSGGIPFKIELKPDGLVIEPDEAALEASSFHPRDVPEQYQDALKHRVAIAIKPGELPDPDKLSSMLADSFSATYGGPNGPLPRSTV